MLYDVTVTYMYMVHPGHKGSLCLDLDPSLKMSHYIYAHTHSKIRKKYEIQNAPATKYCGQELLYPSINLQVLCL